MTTTESAPTDIEAQVGALAERLFFGGIAAMEALSIYLGAELGLYATLSEAGPMTAPELARAAGIHPRYAQEWLEQQAVAELIGVAELVAAGVRTAPPDRRRYFLSDAAAAVLVDPTSL